MPDDDPLNPPEDREESGSEDQEEPQPDEAEQEGAGEKAGGSERTSGHMLHKGEFTAPSVGPHTVFEKRPPEERLDFDKISDTDAMGKEKKRKVVGGTYGPTRTRVFATFATFFAVVAALAVGFYFLAKELDQPPKENPAEAPWSEAGAEQKKPRPIQ